MQYSYDIIYKKDKEYLAIDVLSRLHGVESNCFTTSLWLFELLKRLKDSCLTDENLQTIISAKQQDTNAYEDYFWHQGN